MAHRNIRKVLKRCAVTVLVGTCLSQTVTAQTTDSQPDANLDGVLAVRITFSQLTPDAINCGLTIDRFQSTLSDELQRTGFRLSETTDTLVTLGLMTTFDPGRNACGTSATLGVYRKVSYFDEAVGWLKSGYVVLWQRGQQVMSGIAEHSDATATVTQRLIDVLGQSWRAENKSDAS
ncbi:MAG: hypothetical protein ACO35B_09640 [Luminiphilus sp.]